MEREIRHVWEKPKKLEKDTIYFTRKGKRVEAFSNEPFRARVLMQSEQSSRIVEGDYLTNKREDISGRIVYDDPQKFVISLREENKGYQTDIGLGKKTWRETFMSWLCQ